MIMSETKELDRLINDYVNREQSFRECLEGLIYDCAKTEMSYGEHFDE